MSALTIKSELTGAFYFAILFYIEKGRSLQNIILKKMNTHADQEFVEFVVKSLVNEPGDVSTVRSVDEMGVLLTLKVNPSDMGVVIGKQGQTARALRTLLRVVGAKNNARVNLKIEEPEGSTRMPRPDKSQSVDDVVDNLKL